MSQWFDVVARTAQGELTVQAVQAHDIATAAAMTQQRGWQVVQCQARKRTTAAGAARAPWRSAGWDTTLFAQELSSLVTAGLSLPESVTTLATKERAAAGRSALQQVSVALAEGRPLSAALAQVGSMPPLLVATVLASEQTGDIAPALERYAAHQTSLQALRDKVVGASIYPALLLGVGSLVVMFLLGVVVPKFAVLIESTRAELPWSSRLLMAWGSFVGQHALALLALVAAGLLGLAGLLRRAASQGFKVGWFERLPYVGPLSRQFRHAQLYRTTGMLLRGGIALPRALGLCVSLLGHADQAQLRRAITLVEEGQDISTALQRAGMADVVATSMLAVAQRTGALVDVLERIARFYELRLQRAIEVGSRLFEPVLMIFIGLLIGGIVVLMYLPIFDLASSLQ
jgi:general secretion pathway protein F